MEGLDESVVWRKAAVLGLDQNVARSHSDVYDLEEKGESVVVTYISATDSETETETETVT